MKVIQSIGRYRVEALVGTGAMGEVYRAYDPVIDRPVAIKFLSAQKADDKKSVARFLREARASGKLAHPNVVTVYDAGQSDGMYYIVMELVEGPSARSRIREAGPSPSGGESDQSTDSPYSTISPTRARSSRRIS